MSIFYVNLRAEFMSIRIKSTSSHIKNCVMDIECKKIHQHLILEFDIPNNFWNVIIVKIGLEGFPSFQQ